MSLANDRRSAAQDIVASTRPSHILERVSLLVSATFSKLTCIERVTSTSNSRLRWGILEPLHTRAGGGRAGEVQSPRLVKAPEMR